MNNFRHHQSKSFGNRSSNLPHPWMTEEEIANMRRQNPHFQPIVTQSMNSNMHSPLLNQPGILPLPNKTFMNQSSCKMPSSNFTHSFNPDIFKSPHSGNELSYSNRFLDNRLPNHSYPHANLQHKMNEGPIFKDFPTPNMISHQSRKSDGFPTLRHSQERLSCMQNDQAQLNTKYNSPLFQEKDFPFPSQKEPHLSNNLFNERVPVSIGSNLPSHKANFRTTTLFPAYTPKDDNETAFHTHKPQSMQEENVKSVHSSVYSSDFLEKSNSFYDKTALSPRYSQTMETFHEKSEAYEGKNASANDVFKLNNKSSFLNDSRSLRAMPNSPVLQDSYKIANPEVSEHSFKTVNSQVSQDPYKTLSNSQVSHDSFKTMPNSQMSHDSLKTFENKVSPSNTKYPFSSENQQACFQSSNEISFQRSQSLPVSTHINTTASRDCLMQNTHFSSQSDLPENTKETFSSFNFESNITDNSTDIADLLPGLDAFLKETLSKAEETLNKPEDDVAKNDFAKSSIPNCAFSDDEWSKHSIPFIGDNQVSNNNNPNDIIKESYGDELTGKERCNKFESSSEKTTELKLTDINQSNTNLTKQNQEKSVTFENETTKVRSALEEAIDLLVTSDPIVGLDYIIEYKKNISQQGSFPFRCNLCNSGITRPSIIDHIIGSKHRMRYLKIKNESIYESIVSLKVDKSLKDAKIAEAAFQMETVYGRGSVIVNTEDSPKGLSVGSSLKETNEGIEEPVFTLDKIPTIGFEALSPQLDDLTSADFTLESDLTHRKQDSGNTSQKDDVNTPVTCTEMKKEVNSDSSYAVSDIDIKQSSSDVKCDVTPAFLENNLKNDLSKNSFEETNTETSSKSSPTKRLASLESPSHAKKMKPETIEESEPCSDSLTTQGFLDIKTEDSSPGDKGFDLDILDALSKSEISSEEEASIVLKVISMLMQMYLQFKLHHLPLEKMENLMKSLQIKSPECIEELKSLLKDCKVFDKSEDKKPVEENKVNQMNKEKLEQNLTSYVENNDMKTSQPSESSSILNSSGSDCGLTNNTSQPAPDVCQSSTSSGLYTVSTAEASKKAASQAAAVSQSGNSIGLRPPPFFGWPQTSDSLTNVSYAGVQGSQNMMWSSAYQHSQAQYAQLPYFQPQNYANTFSGTQAYQAQFPVLSQNATMSLNMTAQPPLPPPPPLPPTNPPLPPSGPLLPNPPSGPLLPNPPSGPLLPNPPSGPLLPNPPCMSLYSNNQPPLPPLP